MSGVLLSLGHGYSARALEGPMLRDGWRILGTTRDADKAREMATRGVEPLLWDDTAAIVRAIGESDHVLTSVAPDASGDPVLQRFAGALTERAPDLAWVGYLSTTGVYGDHGGAWVDEDTALNPSTRRGTYRVAAEAAWAAVPGLPLHIFRLAGIYGPGRGPFAKVRAGTARRIIKKNQVFSRIHVDDIAQVLLASIHAPDPGAVYNVCDDHPAPPEDVIAYAAELLGREVPPAEDFNTAEMTPMARSFYAESKRVRNDCITRDLGVRLLYPDYQSGLRALLAGD